MGLRTENDILRDMREAARLEKHRARTNRSLAEKLAAHLRIIADGIERNEIRTGSLCTCELRWERIRGRDLGNVMICRQGPRLRLMVDWERADCEPALPSESSEWGIEEETWRD